MEPNQDQLLRERYRITGKLGHGGMGAVLLAYDTALEIQVAVKSNRNPNEGSQEQFLKEARLLATLRHPNLPRVIDHFIVDDTQYLVMDFIPGDDLEVLLDQQGPPPLDKVMDWARQLTSALVYLHNQNPPIIHRDIKPANVKITPEGQAILVDFGLAKAADPNQATAAGATGYTPGYAPPEQYGGAHTGPYSDQYSLAATLYKLLTNQKPIESIKRLLGEGVLTPMDALNPNMPRHIQQAIEKGMSLQPQDRYASLNDFLEALTNPHYQPTLSAGDRITAPAIPEPSTAPAATRLPSTATIPAATAAAAKPAPAATSPNRGVIFTCLGIAAAVVLLAVAGAAIWYFGFRLPPANTVQATTEVVLAGNADEMTPTATMPPTETPAPSQTATLAPDQATDTPAPTETGTPTASPEPNLLVDERQVVFVSDRGDGETLQLWTMRIAQLITNEIIPLDIQQITFSEGDKSEPEWSPDGSRILYSAPGSNSSNLQIWVLEVQTGETTQLSDMEGNNFNPTWSPDGTKIAFVNFGRFNDVNMIYLMDANGGNRERISLDFQETDPKWTADMEWLLYVIQASGHEYLFWRNKVENYATPEPFDPAAMFGRMGEVDDPALSVDNAYMAYTRTDSGVKQIWTVEFASRGARTLLLTADQTSEYQPAWSPDGNWIVFTSERDGNAEIYIMTSVGLLQSNLSNHPGVDMQPDWQR